MTQKFPDPVGLPSYVFESRHERLKNLISSCAKGIGIRSAIIAAEFAGVLLLGSSALLMDAIASLVDVLSSVVLLVCLKLAARPPDENHPFGHGRYEPLVGLQLGLFLTLIGCVMLFQQGFAVSQANVAEHIDKRVWIIPFFATILLELCYRMTMKAAKRQHSPAMAADAVHYRIDGITSFCATLALVLAAFYPHIGVYVDHIGAIVIAILMVILGLNASWQNMQQLLDRVPDKIFFQRVENAAKRVPGVLGTEKIRIQHSGPDAHVDIDVEVDPTLTVDEAHKISQHVRAEIQKDWPLVQDVIVHIEPFFPNDH